MSKEPKSRLQAIKKFILFSANGLINTGVTYALFVLISNFIDYRITIIIVYVIGIFLSYFLNRKFVFKVKGRLHFFIIIYGGMLLLNLSITTLLVEDYNLIKELAQLIAVIIVAGIGFTLINRYVFRNSTSPNK